jgi:hypothetical protein
VRKLTASLSERRESEKINGHKSEKSKINKNKSESEGGTHSLQVGWTSGYDDEAFCPDHQRAISM